MATKKETTPKAKKATGPKLTIEIGKLEKVSKPMPLGGSGSKYGWLATMTPGDCMKIPLGSTNADASKLKTAITGAARRLKVKVVCAVEKDEFFVWRKADGPIEVDLI